LLEYINEYNIQGWTYYLDIDLGQEMNGIDLADKIRTIDVTGKFTFITTHEEMAPLTLKRKIETFDFIAKHSNDYLKKQLMTNLELVYNRFIQQQKRKAITVVRFKVGNICYKLPIDDVVYITTSDKPHRLTLYTKRGKHEFYGKISEYEEKCLELTKVSQSTLVNFDYVDMFRVDKRMIVFTNGLHVECSKRYVMEIKNKMQGINI
jgi:response regulator of the lytR/algR family